MNIQLGYDVLDSRDVIETIDQLESELKFLVEYHKEQLELKMEGAERTASDIKSLKSQIKPLRAFADAFIDMIGSAWYDGVSLVNDDYFIEYTKEYSDNIGKTSDDDSWPFTHIDWNSAADALQYYFSSVDVDEHKYWTAKLLKMDFLWLEK